MRLRSTRRCTATAQGLDGLVLSEHHAVPDGYLPVPPGDGGVAARTRRIPISVAAVLVNLYEPVRLAEEMAVLDHLSEGRVSYVLALGYRPEEYRLYGREWDGRGALVEASIKALLAAWGEACPAPPPPARGRPVTPAPFSRPHPLLFYGGGSKVVAQEGRPPGTPLLAQVSDAGVADAYVSECRALGRQPGMVTQPSPGPGNVFCPHDPEVFWDRYGHHLFHDARSYDEWHGNLHRARAGLLHHRGGHARCRGLRRLDPRRVDRALPWRPRAGHVPPAVRWPATGGSRGRASGCWATSSCRPCEVDRLRRPVTRCAGLAPWVLKISLANTSPSERASQRPLSSRRWPPRASSP